MHQVDIHKLVDEAKFRRFHLSLMIWCGIILILDGYDLAVAGIALPSIMKEMGVDPTQAGFMVSSALFGMMFGAIGLGALADKIGRLKVIAMSVGLFSIFTAAAGLTNDPILFSVFRFIAGLGIGGALPTVSAHMTEYAPKRNRSGLVTLMLCGYAVGGILAALLGKQFIETYGWQFVFFAAGVPVILVPLVLKYMPESLPFLIEQGRHEKLRAIASQVAPEVQLHSDERFLVPNEDKIVSVPIGKLFQDGRGFSTLMLWLSFVAGLFMLYALSSWLTKLLGTAGYSLGSALNFVLVYNLGAILGAVGGGWLADRLNIKWVLASFYALSVATLLLVGSGPSTSLLFLLILVLGASTLGTQIIGYAYAGQYYPTSIRSTGIGCASGFGRVGGIVAPIVIGVLVSMQLSMAQSFMAIAAVGLVGAIAVALIDDSRSASNQAVDKTKKQPQRRYAGT